jgi:hypothetical protein
VKDVVYLSRYVDKFGYIMIVKSKLLAREEMLDVAQITCQQVVHAYYFIAFGKEAVTKMRAEKASSAGNEYTFQ